MASSNMDRKLPERDTAVSQGLIKGDFDIEYLLAELTIEEKASLLSGIVATYPERLEVAPDCLQARIFGIHKRSQD